MCGGKSVQRWLGLPEQLRDAGYNVVRMKQEDPPKVGLQQRHCLVVGRDWLRPI